MELLRSGQLSAGHARALVTSDRASELARQIVAGGLSVRDTEKLVNADRKPQSQERRPARPTKDADTAELERNLSASLKMSVSVDHDAASGAGRVSIRYKDLAQLDDLVRALGG